MNQKEPRTQDAKNQMNFKDQISKDLQNNLEAF